MKRRNDGPGLVEYALVLVLIAIVVFGILSFFGIAGADCPEGYFYSVREYACIPGFRP